MKKRKRAAVLILIVMAALLIFVFRPENVHDTVTEALGVKVNEGEVLEDYDTHGGFLGDGLSCITLQTESDYLLKQIEKDKRWKKFPADKTVETLLYGNGQDGPYLKNKEGKLFVPKIRNGYYYLKDRQNAGENGEHRNILERYSFNFTLGIYDADTGILYCIEFDT